MLRLRKLLCREAVRSSNAAVVLQTLVPQAREIFKLLAQAQLSEQAEEDGSEGLASSLAMPHTQAWLSPGFLGVGAGPSQPLAFQAAAASELLSAAPSKPVSREGCERGGAARPRKHGLTSVVCS